MKREGFALVKLLIVIGILVILGAAAFVILNQDFAQRTCEDILVDTRDGQSYATVQIGYQCWMAQHLNIGTMISGVSEQTNNGTIEKYCYDDNENNCNSDGGLYQWDEAMQYVTTPGAQGICPVGWHIPTDNEWIILEENLGMCSGIGTDPVDRPVHGTKCSGVTGYRGTDQGTKLKEGGSSGFEAIIARSRNIDGSFGYRPPHASIWSSLESGANAWSRSLPQYHAVVDRSTFSKAEGLSVRCLKD